MSGDGREVVWSEPVRGLRLGISAAGAQLTLSLHNSGDRPLEVLSHVVAAGEMHLDWFRILIDGREIALADERNRSAPVQVTLAPGEMLHHDVDVGAWARRPPNGSRPLSATADNAEAVYEAAAPGCWSGTLHAGPVRMRAAGAPLLF